MPLMCFDKTGVLFESVHELGGDFWVTNLMFGAPVWKDRLPIKYTDDEGKEQETKVLWGAVVTDDTSANWNTTEIDDILWAFRQTELKVGKHRIAYALKVVTKLPTLTYYGLCENDRVVEISIDSETFEVRFLAEGGWLVDPDYKYSDSASILGIDCPVETYSWAMVQKLKPTTPKMTALFKTETGTSILSETKYEQSDIDNWLELFDKAMEKHQ
ncbi:hypothetical protein [Vibrio phage pTD1]|uniref:Uncharacterized protein n=1 Tax=Vibrio phage pTD1 TaxID=1938577 RepID=A0A1Q2U353_9CAUD|nr:hypothetical protein FDH33_gp174 [Vibrio phage pTD1]BAW98383.1 hypothetical protein [Vibrio phage pTD1]